MARALPAGVPLTVTRLIAESGGQLIRQRPPHKRGHATVRLILCGVSAQLRFSSDDWGFASGRCSRAAL
jgi:hypothetical protein